MGATSTSTLEIKQGQMLTYLCKNIAMNGEQRAIDRLFNNPLWWTINPSSVLQDNIKRGKQRQSSSYTVKKLCQKYCMKTNPCNAFFCGICLIVVNLAENGEFHHKDFWVYLVDSNFWLLIGSSNSILWELIGLF